MYRLVSNADTNGVSTMGEIQVPPSWIVARFGQPAKSDEYKVSGEYVFASAKGDVFVVHDWKSTGLWESGLPSPKVFWAETEPAEFSVASRDLETADFERWFLEQLKQSH